MALLEKFGFDEDFLKRWRVHDEDGKAIIPYYYSSKDGASVLIDENGQERRPDPAPIFNDLALQEEKAFLCLSVLDALSIEAAHGPALAAGSDFCDEIAEINLLPSRFVIVIPNNNEDAAERAAEIAAAIEKRGRAVDIVRPPKWTETVNELLRRDPARLAGLVKNGGIEWLELEQNRIRDDYERDSSASAALDGFFDRVYRGKNEPIPTGYTALDKALEGGLYTGLYALGAASNFGKTTYALQMALQIAKAGTDVLFFSLEMGREELLAKALSNYTFYYTTEDALAQQARTLLVPSKMEALNSRQRDHVLYSLEMLQSATERLWINEGKTDDGRGFGVKDICEAVEKHRSITGRAPVVFIDYLQILQPESDRITDKMAVDRNVRDLRRMAREYDCPVICISSFNRENYNAPVNMAAFKESGSIEYSSDVILAIQPSGMKALDGEGDLNAKKAYNARLMSVCKNSPVRNVEVVILKSRLSQPEAKIQASYYAPYNYFAEKGQRKAAPRRKM